MSTRLISVMLAAAAFVAAVGVADAFDRRIRIKNDTGQAIVSLSATSAESGWSGQVLGGLASGKAAMAKLVGFAAPAIPGSSVTPEASLTPCPVSKATVP